MLIDTESLKVDVSAWTELWLDWSWNIDWALRSQLCHAVLHDRELDGDDSCHFNGSTEGDLSIALRKVQVTNGEFGARNVHREEDLAATGEVLDIAVSSVFGATRNGSCALLSDLFLDRRIACTSVDVARLWWFCNDAVYVAASGDEISFTFVPRL